MSRATFDLQVKITLIAGENACVFTCNQGYDMHDCALAMKSQRSVVHLHNTRTERFLNKLRHQQIHRSVNELLNNNIE